MTQPFMQTLPMLSQYVNTGFATKHILRGIKVAGAAMTTGNAPKGYEAEYKRAVQEGIVDPQKYIYADRFRAWWHRHNKKHGQLLNICLVYLLGKGIIKP